MRRVAAAMAIALALAACAALERAAPGPGAAGGERPAEELATYLERLRGLGEGRLAAEAARQRDRAAREPGDLPRVKAALALTLAPHSEESEIIALVEPVAARREASGPVRAMASFLQAIAAERRRLRESAAAAGVRAREERRALDSERQRADALQERAAQLQQKLDALSSIEKSLSDRQPPSR